MQRNRFDWQLASFDTLGAGGCKWQWQFSSALSPTMRRGRDTSTRVPRGKGKVGGVGCSTDQARLRAARTHASASIEGLASGKFFIYPSGKMRAQIHPVKSNLL
jgi:hypothetical protein